MRKIQVTELDASQRRSYKDATALGDFFNGYDIWEMKDGSIQLLHPEAPDYMFEETVEV